MEDVLILDADSIAYKAAAANESKSISVKNLETDKTMVYDNRTAWRNTLKIGEDEAGYEVTDIQDPRHSSYGKSLIRQMIEGYTIRSRIPSYEIYIGGEGNFRENIQLPARYTLENSKNGGSIGGRYKSNRDDNIRPVQLKELRSFMINELNAIPVHGQEVDDMSSIRAYTGAKEGRKIIQCTEDKDALGCTGWLWNPVKDKEPRYISGFGELHREGTGVKGTGRLWFYYQVLYGDPVDGYHGVDLAKMIADKDNWTLKFGQVAAYNILKDARNDKEALKYVYDTYKSWYPNPVTYITHAGVSVTKDAVDIMQMYVDCAHMRRWENDVINCEAMLTKVGVL